MTSPLDDLLTRALLIDDTAAPHKEPSPSPTAPPPSPHRAADPTEGRRAGRGGEPERLAKAAARDLRTLCEAVVTAQSVTTLTDSLTDYLPTPSGALVLACVLQLNDTEQAARFWWQYAAGAGETTACYCLYLHHLAHHEHHEAAWWKQQAPLAAPPDPSPGTAPPGHPAEDPAPAKLNWHSPSPAGTRTIDPCTLRTLYFEWPGTAPQTVSVAATLRLLSILKLDHHGRCTYPSAVAAVMDYVAITVHFDNSEPDLELPLPERRFQHRIRALTTAHRTSHRDEKRLPERKTCTPHEREESPVPWRTVALFSGTREDLTPRRHNCHS